MSDWTQWMLRTSTLLRDLKGALDKLGAALSPAMKKFLDKLPRVITAKAPHAKKQDTQTYQTTARLLEASVAQRIVSMRFHSQESGREKEYLAHPYRSRPSRSSPNSIQTRSRIYSGSIGGAAVKVQLRFHPQIAASIKERTWHASQQFKARSDGSVVMMLEVCDDYALRSWILGFGRVSQVIYHGLQRPLLKFRTGRCSQLIGGSV